MPGKVTPAGPLHDLIRQRGIAARLADAALVRNFPDCLERTSEADRLIREAMFDCCVGEITDEERDAILRILSFAIPPLPASEVTDNSAPATEAAADDEW